MKKSTFQDYKYYLYGAITAGAKSVLTGETINPYYSKSANQQGGNWLIPELPSVAKFGGFHVNVTTHSETDPTREYNTIVYGQREELIDPEIDLGGAAAHLAKNVANTNWPYRNSNRGGQQGDCSSLVSRVYHALLPNDRSFCSESAHAGAAVVNNQYNINYLLDVIDGSIMNTQNLFNYFNSKRAFYAANWQQSIPDVIAPGDVILWGGYQNAYAYDSDRRKYYGIIHAGIYVGHLFSSDYNVVDAGGGKFAHFSVCKATRNSRFIIGIARPSLIPASGDCGFYNIDTDFEHKLNDNGCYMFLDKDENSIVKAVEQS